VTGPVAPSRGPLRPLGLTDVVLTGGLWARLQDVNAAATLAHCEQWMEKLGWLANFDRVADGTTGPDRPGWCFSDSEVYKLLEAYAWEYGRTGDPAADEAVRRLTARVGRAQDVDGYLNTAFGHAGHPPRYSDLEMGHELYCVGHLLQAAVARLRTTGADDLEGGARAAWFDVSCCPTNVARTLATWHTYAAAAGERSLTLLQYAPSRVETTVGDGVLGVEVSTGYPADGRVSVRITRAPAGPVALRLRVPPWATGAVLAEGGRRTDVAPGFAVVDRELVTGETIELTLPMSPRFTWPDHRVDAVRGCVAVERGPLVLCVESPDLPPGVSLDDVRVPAGSVPSEVDGTVTVRAEVCTGPAEPWPYGSPAGSAVGTPVELPLVPYYRWAERGPAAMRVWLPVAGSGR